MRFVFRRKKYPTTPEIFPEKNKKKNWFSSELSNTAGFFRGIFSCVHKPKKTYPDYPPKNWVSKRPSLAPPPPPSHLFEIIITIIMTPPLTPPSRSAPSPLYPPRRINKCQLFFRDPIKSVLAPLIRIAPLLKSLKIYFFPPFLNISQSKTSLLFLINEFVSSDEVFFSFF